MSNTKCLISILTCLQLLILMSQTQAQIKVQPSAAAVTYREHGGFSDKYHYNSGNFSFGLNISANKDSTLLGWVAGLSFGKRQFVQAYPLSYDAVVNGGAPGTGSYQGFIYNNLDLFLGANFRVKKMLEIRCGPFTSCNLSIVPNENMTVDPSFFSPSKSSEVYKRFEWGVRMQACLNVPIGKHFSVSVLGGLGSSFNDARVDKWSTAFLRAYNPQTNEYQIPLKSTRLTYRSYSIGLAVGFAW